MSEENEQPESPQTADTGDPRFEVKWRKKNDEPARPVPEVVLPDVADLERRLAEAEERAGTLQERWHRAQADLVNLRKRTEQERGEVEKFASMMLVAELLPVLDNFERALNTLPGNLSMLTWIQGVMLIERHFRAILEHQGVAPIEAEGQQFNPHLHEAIGERATNDSPPGTIVQVYQKGYTMHGRVLRPSLVEIAAALPDAAPERGAEAQAVGTDEPSGEDIAEAAETQNTGP